MFGGIYGLHVLGFPCNLLYVVWIVIDCGHSPLEGWSQTIGEPESTRGRRRSRGKRWQATHEVSASCLSLSILSLNATAF